MRTPIRSRHEAPAVKRAASPKPRTRSARKPAERNIFEIIGEMGSKIPVKDLEKIPKNQIEYSGGQTSHRLSGRELLALPQKDAARIMKRASTLAAKDYEPGGRLRIFEANDSLLDD